MKKKSVFPIILGIAIIITGLLTYNFYRNNSAPDQKLNSPEIVKKAEPSETVIDYSDPAGFSFSYPDNISIAKAEAEDSETYTDLQLFSKDVSGSITLKITDSKFTSVDGWLTENKISESNIKTAKKLGTLEATEVRTGDRLMLAALDQGVLFTVEMPLIEQEFWVKVYDKVLTDFAFNSPETGNSTEISAVSDDEVFFEGEEVVE